MKFSISETSKLFGVTKDTLRYYDKIDLVKPKRTENNYRYYDEKDHLKIKYITVLKYVKFSLNDIKVMLKSFERESKNKYNGYHEIAQQKKNWLIDTANNYMGVASLFDKILPMVSNAKEFDKNLYKIDKYIENLYESINKGEDDFE